MKQLLALPLAPVTGVALVACEGTTTEPDPLLQFHGSWHADEIEFTADAGTAAPYDAYAAGDRFAVTVEPTGAFTQTWTHADGTVETETGTVAATTSGLRFTTGAGATWDTTIGWDGTALVMTRAGVQHDFGAGWEDATLRTRMRLQ
jgi:hypothetical protein